MINYRFILGNAEILCSERGVIGVAQRDRYCQHVITGKIIPNLAGNVGGKAEVENVYLESALCEGMSEIIKRQWGYRWHHLVGIDQEHLAMFPGRNGGGRHQTPSDKLFTRFNQASAICIAGSLWRNLWSAPSMMEMSLGSPASW